jgi:16S rRNA (cytidine1402-2'-O)-methyltransferase
LAAFADSLTTVPSSLTTNANHHRTGDVHSYNTQGKADHIRKRIKSGSAIALISDAGTPLISDPGQGLVKLLREDNIPVFPVPGPCAAIAALSTSGCDVGSFNYRGFISATNPERNKDLLALKKMTTTTVLYEAPHRLVKTLTDLQSSLGGSVTVTIQREITKLNEQWWSGSLDEAVLYWGERTVKGEIVMLLSPSADKKGVSDDGGAIGIDPIVMVKELIDNDVSPAHAARITSSLLKVKKGSIYKLAVDYGAERGNRK